MLGYGSPEQQELVYPDGQTIGPILLGSLSGKFGSRHEKTSHIL